MRSLRLPSLVLGLAVLSSCAFDQRWAATPMQTSANPAIALAGKWEGSWQSDSTAYRLGRLQAIIEPTQKVKAKEGVAMQEYHAEIKMTLLDFFSNEHKVYLVASPDKNGRMHFQGKVDRGTPFGGIYYYDGYVDNDKFFCDYTSDRDSGTFLMHRLTLELQPH